jgi:hypothetical protein
MVLEQMKKKIPIGKLYFRRRKKIRFKETGNVIYKNRRERTSWKLSKGKEFKGSNKILPKRI